MNLSHCNLSHLVVTTYHIIITISITPALHMQQVHLNKTTKKTKQKRKGGWKNLTLVNIQSIYQYVGISLFLFYQKLFPITEK